MSYVPKAMASVYALIRSPHAMKVLCELKNSWPNMFGGDTDELRELAKRSIAWEDQYNVILSEKKQGVLSVVAMQGALSALDHCDRLAVASEHIVPVEFCSHVMERGGIRVVYMSEDDWLRFKEAGFDPDFGDTMEDAEEV